MKKYFSLLLTTTILFSCSNEKEESKNETTDSIAVENNVAHPMNIMEKEREEHQNTAPKESPYKDSKIDVCPFKNEDNTWGYHISIEGNKYVNQPNVPAVPGNKGFSTQAKANITGQFVAYKIRNNIMPPSVTVQELDSLGVLR